MKIICDSCRAKYSIADEKVAGKVFKIRCKKCSNMIVVRGDQGAVGNSPSSPPTVASAQSVSASGVSQSVNPTVAMPPMGMGMGTPSVQPTVASAPAMQAYDAMLAGNRASSASAEPVWHVVVGGDQQGPFAPGQLGEMLTVGTIDWDAYVWREGFDGWVPARDVPELVEAITGQPYDSSYASGTAEPAAAAANPFASSSPGAASSPFSDDNFSGGFGGDDAFGGAPQRDSSAGGAGSPLGGLGGGGLGGLGDGGLIDRSPAHEVASRAANRSSGPDLFGGRHEAPGIFTGPAPTTMPDQSSMTGQRNENSVLFSLANLQALATESTSAPARPSVKPGHAVGEGSGLIDIRALAAATGVGGGGASRPMNIGASNGRPKEDRLDDLMSIGTGSPLAMGSLGAPVLAPVRDDGNKKLYLALAGVAGLLVILLGVVVMMWMSRGEGALPTAPSAPIIPVTAPGAAPPAAPTPGAPGASAAGSPTAPTPAPSAALPGSALPSATDTAGDTHTGARDGNRRRTGGPARGGGGGDSASAAPAPTPTPPKARGGDSIDDLLDNAIGGGGGGGKTAPRETGGGGGGSDEALPDQPPRDAVAAALRSVAGEVKSCGGGKHGMATTKVTVSGSTGRVTNATVTNAPFQGTPEGSCIARAVRAAKFPRFKRPSMSVDFPYAL